MREDSDEKTLTVAGEVVLAHVKELYRSVTKALDAFDEGGAEYAPYHMGSGKMAIAMETVDRALDYIGLQLDNETWRDITT